MANYTDYLRFKATGLEVFSPKQPICAGLAVIAQDTGRVLMLQRALKENDPAQGKWEFPGGTIEPNEESLTAAVREWKEETGQKLPDGKLTGNWTSPNGVYKGYVYQIPQEQDLEINLNHEDRKVLNPDDPDGDEIEVVAWWTIEDLKGNPALRDEVHTTNWDVLQDAILASAHQLYELYEFYNKCHSPDTGKFCETLVGDLSSLSPENQEAVREIVKKIPEDIQKILSKKGIKVVAYSKVLRGEGGRLDYGGQYVAEKREVQISEKAFEDLSTHQEQGDAHFVLHEFGHAVDHVLGYPSKTPEFRSIWKDTQPKASGYFQKSFGGSDPRQELLAEAYAHHWSGTNSPEFTTTPYLVQIMDELRHNVQTGVTAAAITEFANPCHNPETGRFCEHQGPTGDRTIPVESAEDELDEHNRVKDLISHYGRGEFADEMGGTVWAMVGESPGITAAAEAILDATPFDSSDRFRDYHKDQYDIAKTILTTIEKERSDVPLYSGHRRGQEDIASMIENGVSFPLVATSPDPLLAEQYAGFSGKLAKAVVFEFPKGTQSGFYQANEHITTGEFEVTEHTVDNMGRTRLTLRQARSHIVPEPRELEEEE